jgi:hypothetical protein
MLTGAINLDKLTKSKKVNLLIRFIVVGHGINLLGPSTSVPKEIHTLLATRAALEREHITLTAQFPEKHALRTLITQACVKSYTLSLQLRSSWGWSCKGAIKVPQRNDGFSWLRT